MRFAQLGLIALLPLAACSLMPEALRSAPAVVAAPSTGLVLDPEASPLAFRRLRADALLVSPNADARELAELGNYIAAAAEPLASAHIVVYSSAEPWKDHEAPEPIERRPAAEYRKTPGQDGIDRFVVFAADGGEEYQRNFRDWPLAKGD